MGSHPHHSNKKDLGISQSLFYGASSGNLLQPLAPIIAQELEKTFIQEMQCYA